MGFGQMTAAVAAALAVAVAGGWLSRLGLFANYALMAWLPGDDFPLYQEFGADEGTRYPEVAAALSFWAAAR